MCHADPSLRFADSGWRFAFISLSRCLSIPRDRNFFRQANALAGCPLVRQLRYALLPRYERSEPAIRRRWPRSDRDRDAPRCFIRISAYNVIEVAKTRNVQRRDGLVRLMRRLAQNKRPLDRPNGLIRGLAKAYMERNARGTATYTANIDPNLERLWLVL